MTDTPILVQDAPQMDPALAEARRNSHHALRRRTLERMRSKSTDLDTAPRYVDPRVYTDPSYAQRERKAVFENMPILAGFTMDIPEPGNMMVFDVLGPSILICRNKEGIVKAYLNMCSHRAAKLVTECNKRTRLTCRFHGWTFDLNGKLIGLPGKEGFEGMDRDERGLIPIPVAEWKGMIFVRAKPGTEPLDVADFLGDFGDELAHLELHLAKPVRSSRIDCAANWKYALDTYGESYHFATLHPTTIGALAFSNMMVYDNYGFHARLAFPRGEFVDYADRDESEWPHTDYGGLYMLFPNVVINVNSIIGVGQFYGVSRIFPGETVDSSATLLGTYQPAHSGEKVDVEKWSEMHDFIEQVIRTEDYSVSQEGQQNLRYAPEGFRTVLGRNEIALQHHHRNLESLVGAPG